MSRDLLEDYAKGKLVLNLNYFMELYKGKTVAEYKAITRKIQQENRNHSIQRSNSKIKLKYAIDLFVQKNPGCCISDVRRYVQGNIGLGFEYCEFYIHSIISQMKKEGYITTRKQGRKIVLKSFGKIREIPRQSNTATYSEKTHI